MSCHDPTCLVDKMGCISVYTGDMECQGEWRVLHRIGVHGAQGEVYKVCSPTSCDFAFKHIRNHDELPIEMLHEEVRREAHMQELAAIHGIAPPVLQVILDKDSGAIIMPALQDSMKRRYNNAVYRRDEDMILSLVQTSATLLNRLHNIGITHKDMHLDNLMCDAQDRWYIIDFDRSRNIKDVGDKVYDILLLRSAFIKNTLPHLVNRIEDILPRPDGV